MPPTSTVYVRAMPGSDTEFEDPIRLIISDSENPRRIFFKVEISRRRLLRALATNGEKETIHGTMMGKLVR